MSETVTSKYGVLLMNMGGPRSGDEIFGYLYRLFSDPYILGLPGMLRKGLAFIIARTRRNKAAARYDLIGGKSPLDEETAKQVRALEETLQIPVTYAMRYTEPSVKNAAHQLKQRGVSHLVVLPLYPQYSFSTTASALEDFQRHSGWDGEVEMVDHHHDYPPYVAAMSHLLHRGLDNADPGFDPKHDPKRRSAVIFVAHSIPLKQVKAGDPYVKQVEETVAHVVAEKPLPCPHYVAYQSRVGPVEWQGPEIDDVLRQLVNEGVRQLVVQPVSFVSENLETLFDLDIEFKKSALEAGIESYIRIPAPGTDSLYIGALASRTRAALKQWETGGNQ